MRGRLRSDEGSTIPLILGFVVVAALVVFGGIAAGDAFVDQRDVQGVCDGATLAAASAVDVSGVRSGSSGVTSGAAVRLMAVQRAASAYVARDPARRGVTVASTLTVDGLRVDSTCSEVLPLTFGRAFGFGGGVRHVVTSSASTVLQ